MSFLKKALFNTLFFFVTWVILDLIFGNQVDWLNAVIYAVVFAVIAAPISEFVMKKLKM